MRPCGELCAPQGRFVVRLGPLGGCGDHGADEPCGVGRVDEDEGCSFNAVDSAGAVPEAVAENEQGRGEAAHEEHVSAERFWCYGKGRDGSGNADHG